MSGSTCQPGLTFGHARDTPRESAIGPVASRSWGRCSVGGASDALIRARDQPSVLNQGQATGWLPSRRWAGCGALRLSSLY